MCLFVCLLAACLFVRLFVCLFVCVYGCVCVPKAEKEERQARGDPQRARPHLLQRSLCRPEGLVGGGGGGLGGVRVKDFWVLGLGFRVKDFWVLGLGFRVEDFWGFGFGCGLSTGIIPHVGFRDGDG